MKKGTAQYGYFVRIPYTWFGLRGKYKVVDEKRKTSGKENVNVNDGDVCLLARIAGWNDSGMECMETNEDLAEYLHVSIPTVKRYLSNLRLAGFIKTFEEKDVPVHTCKRIIYVHYDRINQIVPLFSSESTRNEVDQPLSSSNQLDHCSSGSGSPIISNNNDKNNIYNKKT